MKKIVLITILTLIMFSGMIFIRLRLNLIANSIDEAKDIKQEESEITPTKIEISQNLKKEIEKLQIDVASLENQIINFEIIYYNWLKYIDDEWAKLFTDTLRQKFVIQLKLLQEIGIKWENPPEEITQGVTSSITQQRVKLAMNIISDFINKEAETIAQKVSLTQEQKKPFQKAVKEFLQETEKNLITMEFTELDLDKKDFYADILDRFEAKLKPVLQPEQQQILEKHLSETWARRLRR